jgi:hypothetical protein
MRLLDRLRPGHHRVELQELAVILGLRFRPDHLHGLDAFARQLVAARESGAVVGHLILVPAIADAEQETAARDLVDRSDLLGRLDRVALSNQANAGPEQQRFGDRRGRTEHHERVHHVIILLRKVAATGEGRVARQRNVGMFGHPERIEAALLQRQRQFGRRHRIVREKHLPADPHRSLPRVSIADQMAGDGFHVVIDRSW